MDSGGGENVVYIDIRKFILHYIILLSYDAQTVIFLSMIDKL